MRAKPLLTAVLKGSITLALFAILLSRTSIEGILQKTGSVGSLVLLAAGTLLFCLLPTTAVRWQLVLKSLGAPLGLAEIFRYTLIGGFFNQLLPSGMGGDVLRAWYAKSADVPLVKAVASVVVDRLLAVMALLLIVVAGIPFAISSGLPRAALAALTIVASAFVFAVAVFVAIDRGHDRLLAFFASKAGTAARAVEGLLHAVRDTRRMMLTWPDGPVALGISLANHVAAGYAAYLLVVALGGQVALVSAIILFLMVLLLTMLPISFAGWGVREGAMVVAFGFAGVPAEVSLGASILYGACQLAAALPGAVVWLLNRRAVPGNA